MIKPIQLVAIYDDDQNDLIIAIVQATKEDMLTLSGMLYEGSKCTKIDYCGWRETQVYAPNTIDDEGLRFFSLDFEDENSTLNDIVEFVERYL